MGGMEGGEGERGRGCNHVQPQMKRGGGGGVCVEPVSAVSAAAAMLLSAACLGALRSSAGITCRRYIPESQVI